jgi:hypothetical protein
VEFDLGAGLVGRCGFALVLSPAQTLEPGLGFFSRADLYPRRHPPATPQWLEGERMTNSLLVSACYAACIYLLMLTHAWILHWSSSGLACTPELLEFLSDKHFTNK